MGLLSWVQGHLGEVFSYLGLLFVSYEISLSFYRLYFHPLSKFPGPTICAVSRLYEFYWDSMRNGRLLSRLPELHRKYGPIIRISPDEVHISDSEYFDTIFGFRPLDKKATLAKQFLLKHPMFATEDHKLHKMKKAAFGDAFSHSRALKMQGLLDETIDKACGEIEARAAKGQAVDLAYIFRAIPSEFVTEYLFGEKYDFIGDEKTTRALYDKRFDVIFGLSHLGRFMPPVIPLMYSLIRQQIKQALGTPEPGSAFMAYFGFARKLSEGFIEEYKNPTSRSLDRRYPTAFDDFIRSNLPEEEKSGFPLAQHAMAIWSGSWDSAGFSLTVAAYCILRNPSVYEKVRSELKQAWKDPHEGPPSPLEDLPYLTAVIKEALRLSPGIMFRLSRVNPTGAEQYGKWTIPPGTTISMSLFMVSHDEKIWGPDHDTFRPERWLGPDSKHLDRFLVAFSKGTRACIAEDFAWLILRLTLGTLFRRYDMHIPDQANVTDDDIMPYHEGGSAAPKTWIHRLPVTIKVEN